MRGTGLSGGGIAVILALLSLSSSGCMLSPQHGEDIGSINNRVEFYGATWLPGQRIEVQALNPFGGWERIAQATTIDAPIEKESGTWYGWSALALRVPARYWRDTGGGRMSAVLRARSLDGDFLGDTALFTFEDGFDPNDYTDVGTMWDEYGHGRSLTIYGHR